MFMNDYDLECARRTFTQQSCPNLLGLVYMVEHLAEYADANSDGWAYWAAPRNAAKRAMEAIYEGERRVRLAYADGAVDCTDEDVARYARPVKAFLTRQKVRADQREIILRSVTN